MSGAGVSVPPPPLVACAADAVLSRGRQVRGPGTYGAQDLGKHPVMVTGDDGKVAYVHRLAYIELANGSFVVLAARSKGEMKALEGKEVVATGTLVIEERAEGAPPMARAVPVPTLVGVSDLVVVDR